MNKSKLHYTKPSLQVVCLQVRKSLLAGSEKSLQGSARLNTGWTDKGNNPWNNSLSSGEGSSLGNGWKDNGSSPWE